MATLLLSILLALQDKQPDKQPEKKEPQELTREQTLDEDIKDLIKKLSSDNELESFWAKEELVLLGRLAKVQEELLKTFRENGGANEKSIRIRHVICDILGELRNPTPEIIDILKAALKEGGVSFGTSIATVAVNGLVKLGREEMIPEFIKMLESEDKQIKYDKFLQWELIRALGVLRAKQASVVLKKYLSDNKSKTSEEEDSRLLCAQAAESLGKIRDKSAVEELVKYMEDNTKDNASGKEFSFFVAHALEKITGENKGNLSGTTEEANKAKEAWKTWCKERIEEGNVKNTSEKIKKLAQAIEKFEQEQKRLPNNLDELKKKPDNAPVWPEKGYWQEDFIDSWSSGFIYRSGNQATGAAKFDIISYASDKKPGGLGHAMDIWNHEEWKKVAREKSQKAMNEIADALDKFKKDCGRYPQQLLDITVTLPPNYAPQYKGPYIKEIPKDGFDSTIYFYKFPDKAEDKKPYELKCYGYDKKEGGKDIEEDFSIWGFRKPPE